MNEYAAKFARKMAAWDSRASRLRRARRGPESKTATERRREDVAWAAKHGRRLFDIKQGKRPARNPGPPAVCVVEAARELSHCVAVDDCPGFLYAVKQSCALGLIKVGHSLDVRHRLRAMQTDNPYQLSIAGTAIGTRADEAALHRRLAQHRMRGEWYRDEGAVSEWISGLSRPDLDRPRAPSRRTCALSRAQVNDIRKAARLGKETVATMATKYGVNESTIRGAMTGSQGYRVTGYGLTEAPVTTKQAAAARRRRVSRGS